MTSSRVACGVVGQEMDDSGANQEVQPEEEGDGQDECQREDAEVSDEMEEDENMLRRAAECLLESNVPDSMIEVKLNNIYWY